MSDTDEEVESADENIQNILEELMMEEMLEENVDGDLIRETEVDQEGWGDFEGRQKSFPFTGPSGIQGTDIAPTITPLEAFFMFVDDEVFELIVTETNRYADQVKIEKEGKQYARINMRSPTNREEIQKFLILLIWMGLVPIGNIADYWGTKSPIYKFEFPRSIMPRNRFQLLLSVLHFNDNEQIQVGERLGKISKLVTMLQSKFQKHYLPAEDFVIDETLVPWRGRLVFRQYIPNKASRYGIKLFKLCSTNGYTWSMKVHNWRRGTGDGYGSKSLFRTFCRIAGSRKNLVCR